MVFPRDFSGHATAEVGWIRHYSSSQKILLVGEADFSFAASLAAAFGSSASNLTATSLESKRVLKKVYRKAVDNIQELKSKGCNVFHAVDATVMASHPSFKNSVFDQIVFNFPFAVVSEKEWGNLHLQTVLKKQHSLVRAFLKNAKKLISENGEIHITHRKDGVFGAWMIKFLASEQGFQLVEAVDFDVCDYPGYNPKWGNGSDNDLESSPSKTYKFRLPRPPLKVLSFSSTKQSRDPVIDVSCSPNLAHKYDEFHTKGQKLQSPLIPNFKHDDMRHDVVDNNAAEEIRWIKHYSSSQKILLVGEGDFSFACSLAAAFGSYASNLTATSLEYKRELKEVYAKAADNIQVLQSKGCNVCHAVDATVMASFPSLKNSVFDRIVFNFPFAVISKVEWSNLHLQTVLEKQHSLVREFLENAKKLISENGEIHITHRRDGVFGAWRIKFFAFEQGFQLVEVVDFDVCDYPGYNPKWGNGSDDNLESSPSKTYKFRLPHPPLKVLSLSSPTEQSRDPVIDVSCSSNLAEKCEEFHTKPLNLPSPSVIPNFMDDDMMHDVVDDIVAEEIRWIKHYSSSQKILLVGEGDFSFACSLAAAFGSASNLTATSLEYKRELKKVYAKAADNIQVLQSKGCKVWHAVDATVMTSFPSLKYSVFDRIVFNFPFAVVSEEEWGNLHLQTVLEKQHSLVRDFLENAKKLISENGEIHITHRKDGIFGAWRIKFLASEQGCQLVEAVDFNICDYPGYNPKWGNGSDDNLESFPSKTYKFKLPQPPLEPVQDVPIFPLINTHLAEQPKGIYEFIENRPYTHPDLASLSVLPDIHILPCGVAAANSSSSDWNLIGCNKNSNVSTEALESVINHNLKRIGVEQEVNMGVVEEEKWLKQYSSSHKMLLVGEGDFSFSASLAAAFGSAVNMVATSFDSKTTLRKVYSKAVQNIKMLNAKGCKVLHSVDATTMASHPSLKGSKFDRIIFNFPLAVVSKHISYPQICKHQSLVKKFLENSKQMIDHDGEIHVTHRTDGVFGSWRIKLLASKKGLELVGATNFNISDYPDYNATWEIGSNDDLKCVHSKTYKFRLPRRLIKTVSPSYSPTEPSSISLEDVSMIQLTNNTILAKQSEEFDYGFTQNSSNTHDELISPSWWEATFISPLSKYCTEYHLNQRHMWEDNVNAFVEEQKMVKDYSSSHQILLVGEGDFSFSASLAVAFGSSSNMTATFLDSRTVLEKQYENAVYHIEELKRSGCKVMHGVDATTMSSHPHLKGSTFDRIVFNFPYASVSEHDSRESQLRAHQSLVRAFLENAKKMIGENGEIHITHRTDGDYGAWRIKFVASQQGLEFVGSVHCSAADYPGYNAPFHKFKSKTYKFRLPRRLFKSVSPSYLPTKPSNNSFEDVSMNQLTSNTNRVEQSEDFDYGFTQNWPNTDEELISISPLSNYCTEYHLKQSDMWEVNVNGFVGEEKMVKHYSSSHKMLLVGEGDFSFSASLAAAFGSAVNMVATSLDSKTTLRKVYSTAVQNIKVLNAKGCKVLHSVDATTMASHPSLKGSVFDRIVFNFPLAVVSKHYCYPQICKHQSLVKKFLENSKQMIDHNGEIHVTHRTDGGFGSWRIKLLASKQGLELVEATNFNISDYPGYNATWEIGSDDDLKCVHSKTYKFRLPRQILKTVSPSYSPTEPSNISPEDVSMIQLTNNTNLAEQSEEFGHGFTRNWSNTDEELLSPSCLEASSISPLSNYCTEYHLKQSDMWEVNVNGFVGEEKMVKHYSSSHKILLVGEGDFSFSASLAAAFGSSSNMTATSLDSEMMLKIQYEKAVYHIEELKRSGCKVMHCVDATTMSSHPHLMGSTFDRIIFNFPYASISEHDSRESQLCAHQSLVRDFLVNAKKMIGENGEIHITHRIDGEYGAWRIKFVATQQGLEFVGLVHFSAADYPGYNVKWGIGCDYKFHKFPSRIYKFKLPSPPSKIHSFPAHQEPVFPITVPNQTEIGYNLFQNEMFFPMMYPYGDSLYAASQNQNGFLPSSMYLGDNQSKQQEKWIKHYSSGQKILLVGEGDFSFSACLAVAFGSAANMTATSLDSEEFLTTNYCKAFLHLRELKSRGCKVMHGIDATCMIYNPSLMGSTFDRIIFNFPYAGFFKEVPRPSQLSCHQALVRLFLANAKRMLRENGEIHITHKTNGFHREWGIVLIGIQEGLELAAAVDFDLADYPGYSNKYGFGGDNHFDCSPSQTYMFRLPRTAPTPFPCPAAFNNWF